MGIRVAEIQPTPNPDATKFILDQVVSEQPASFFNAQAAEGHPLAARLFAIPGVSSVFLLGDFVTVNKRSEARWADITTKVKRVLTGSGETK